MHVVTMDSIGPLVRQAVVHDPPLIYHLEHDPSERHALDHTSAEYHAARSKLEAAMAAHEASVAHVPNQMSLGIDDKRKVCCDWDSKTKYPKLPVCTCDADNFNAYVCKPLGPTMRASVGPGGLTLDDTMNEGIQDAIETMIDPDDAATWPVLPYARMQEA